VLLPGTPAIFDTYDAFVRFRARVANGLSVHPSSVVFRGSTKIGFSIAPIADKLWSSFGPQSDVDLAIVDPDHYHYLDAEVRSWERAGAGGSAFRGQRYMRTVKLRQCRSFYCYRYMDLPDTNLVEKYEAAMQDVDRLVNRRVQAFFFRDWWALQSRFEYDLRQLQHGLRRNELPAPDA
jgi:hypothetical protein